MSADRHTLSVNYGLRAFSVLVMFAIVVGGVSLVTAQDEMPGEVPEGNPEDAKKKKGSLQPRPDDDPKTVQWVAKLGAARANPLSTQAGVLLHHVISPEGDRFYYHREESRADGKDGKPAGVRYALFTIGANKAESRVAETGADATQPLFLGTDRILFSARRYDTNEDNVIDELDQPTLIVSNRDGGNQRNVATLAANESPVAISLDGRDVLISVPGDDDVNGWIVSLNLVRGDRANLVRGFNISLVLDDGRLLVERQQATPPPRDTEAGWNPWGEVVPEGPPPEMPLPTLLDPAEHFLFDPKDRSETVLYASTKRSRITVWAEGSFFGHQEPSEPGTDQPRWSYFGPEEIAQQLSEVLIVDDPQHHDTRSPSQRYNYQVIGWIAERGLLVIEQGKLGSRLLLFDHALKTHRLADFELTARGFVASKDGRTIGWLDVEDTDKNGHLEPWKDNSRLNYLKLE